LDLKDSLSQVQNRIRKAAGSIRWDPQDIQLLAVSKTFPAENIQAAYALGLRDFGENRVQEALEKIPLLPPDTRWHLIGRLQSNKINKILGKFVLIHSIDSLELAQALSSRLSGLHQDILLEVNSSGESSKAGVAPSQAEEAAEAISRLPGLRLRGLMTVGPLTEDLSRQREAFKEMKGLFDRIREKPWAGGGFSILSMGMSGDLEVAIEEGSTLVRVGTALFGKRQ